MRKFFAFIVIFVICLSFVPFTFAYDTSETLPDGARWVDTEEDIALVPVELVQVTEPITSTTENIALVPLDIDDAKPLASAGQGQLQSSVSPVTPSDTNGLKKIMLELLGNYDPVVVEYSYQSSQGYTSYLRDIEPDYVWLCSCAIFLIVLYCIFRIFGMVIGWRR